MSSDSSDEEGTNQNKNDEYQSDSKDSSSSHSNPCVKTSKSNSNSPESRSQSPNDERNGLKDSGDEMDADSPKRDKLTREKDEENEMQTETSRKEKSQSRSRSKSRSRSLSRNSSKDSRSPRKRSRRSRSRSHSNRRSRSRSRSQRRSRSRRRSRSSSFTRRRSRSSDYFRPRGRYRRSRSRGRRRSRSRTPVDGARLHIAEIDVDTRKRDLEKIFERYGRLREIWMARNPPCFAFVVYHRQRDADEAMRETDAMLVGPCRIKVTQARPRVRGGRFRGYDPNLRCYQCGELGHFSRNCTDTKFGYKRPPTPPGTYRNSRGVIQNRHHSQSRERNSRHRSRS